MNVQMNITAVHFKRTKKDDWENGIMIRGASEEIIVDMIGKPVKGRIWDFKEVPYYLHICYIPLSNPPMVGGRLLEPIKPQPPSTAIGA